MYEVEKNVPLPVFRTGQRARYPWLEMAIGDSFFVAGGKITRVAGAACYGKKKGFGTFRCKSVDGGVRVWRTA